MNTTATVLQGRLPQLAGLSEFALQAGPMQGLLRNLRLPQGIKVGRAVAHWLPICMACPNGRRCT